MSQEIGICDFQLRAVMEAKEAVEQRMMEGEAEQLRLEREIEQLQDQLQETRSENTCGRKV